MVEQTSNVPGKMVVKLQLLSYTRVSSKESILELFLLPKLLALIMHPFITRLQNINYQGLRFAQYTNERIMLYLFKQRLDCMFSQHNTVKQTATKSDIADIIF